jgi:4-amino-4-deoxy-L-arabinose transferase-like glycosyltransferase
MALAACGLVIIQSDLAFGFVPSELPDPIQQFAHNSQPIIVGVLITLAGAALAGLAARDVLADHLDALPLPVPKLRRDPVAAGSLVLAAILSGLLYWRLISKEYGQWNVLLFIAGLVLCGFAVYRLDTERRPSTLRFTRIDAIITLLLALFSAVINSTGLVRWNFAWIGDEYQFFDVARSIANGTREANIFDLSLVYGTHPALDSIYQGMVMKVAGVNIVGWRISEVLVVAASAGLIYLLGVAMLGRLPGVAAGVVLGSSHYLMGFTRIAYNNLHALFYSILAVLFLALAWRTQRAIFVYATGVAMGFCLYTLQLAVLIWPIIALVLLLIFLRRPTWKQVLAGALTVLGFALVVTPGLLTTPLDHLIEIARANSQREVGATNPGYVAYATMVRTALSFLSPTQWVGDHYVGGSLVDGITALLLVVGLMTALFRINKRAERLVLIWFALGLVLLAATSYNPKPLLTRMLYLLPPIALLAGIAVAKIERVLRANVGLSPVWATGAVLVLLAPVPLLNVRQFHIDSPSIAITTPELRMMKALEEHPQQVLVEVNETAHPAVEQMLAPYPWLQERYRLISLDKLKTPQPEGAAHMLPIYVVSMGDEAFAQRVREKLPQSYKMIMDEDSQKMSRVWLFVPD